MPLKEVTIRKIEKLANEFFINKIFKLDVNPDIIKKAYPWHSVFFTPEAAIAALKERSLVTSIGMTFVPQLARIIAEDKYNDVHLEHQLHEEIDSGSIRTIDKICRELRGEVGNRTRTPNHNNEMREIADAKTNNSQSIRIVCDLYVGDHNDGPLFFEIKSPKPNLDQTVEAKKKILLFRQISKNHYAYFALHYNPYVLRAKYNWAFCKGIMDLENQVLIGEEMWNHLGDNDTYEEMFEVLRRVSKEKWQEFEEGKYTPRTLSDF